MLTEYRASYGEPADSYAFIETFCDACHTLYSAMLDTRKEPTPSYCLTVVGAMMATPPSDSTPYWNTATRKPVLQRGVRNGDGVLFRPHARIVSPSPDSPCGNSILAMAHAIGFELVLLP